MTSTAETSMQIGKEKQYTKFQNVVFHWPRSMSYNRQYWKNKIPDLAALKVHLDTRNWFQDEIEDDDQKVKKKGGGNSSSRNAPFTQSVFLERNSEDGIENEGAVELFVGHFADMRMVLLLSLDSVERFVQRLHEKGHTSKILPLPEVMSTEQANIITSIERHVVTSQKKLKAVQQKVDKQNKRITHEENMSKWGKEYEHIRRVWQSEETSTFIGFDVETWEVGHKDMLEVGWSVVGPHRPQETSHFIIEEAFADGRRNGRYVADNRRNFLFGTVLDKPLVGRFPGWAINGSEIAYSMAAGRHFMKCLREHRRQGPVYVVFHDSKGDMQVMEEFGIDTRDWSYSMPEKKDEGYKSRRQKEAPTGDIQLSAIIDNQVRKDNPVEKLHPVHIIDTQLLFAAIRCNGTGEKKSLKNICIALDVNDGNLNYFHNAANDAYYTAAALVKMAQGPHFTEMRGIAEARLAEDQDRTAKQNSMTAKRRAPSSSTWD